MNPDSCPKQPERDKKDKALKCVAYPPGGAHDFFIFFEIKQTAVLADLDDFLRAVWMVSRKSKPLFLFLFL